VLEAQAFVPPLLKSFSVLPLLIPFPDFEWLPLLPQLAFRARGPCDPSCFLGIFFETRLKELVPSSRRSAPSLVHVPAFFFPPPTPACFCSLFGRCSSQSRFPGLPVTVITVRGGEVPCRMAPIFLVFFLTVSPLSRRRWNILLLGFRRRLDESR